MNDIRIIEAKKIDREKWNACIENNENGLAYSRSFYLDALSQHWCGLVVNDYEAVMPLTWRRMFGLKYLSKETFIQQSGIIGKPNDKERKEITEKVLKRFHLYGKIVFNYNDAVSYLPNIIKKTNLVLDLQKTYIEVFKNYAESLQRNIRKAIKNNLSVEPEAPSNAANAYRNYLCTFMNPKTIDLLFKKVDYLIRIAPQDFFIARKAVDEDGHTLATCLWLKDNKRIYNLMPSTSLAGKDKVAMPLLLNHVIEEHCGQKLLFDFEGSELPGIKKFYEKFAPVNQPYFLYEYNNLPWHVKLFRK